MSASASPSPLWRSVPSDIHARLWRCLDRAASVAPRGGDKTIFFRADDVAAPGAGFQRLVRLFRRHRAPLTLGVVPAWLTGQRSRVLLNLCGEDAALWGWVQHGWRHVNHEPQGKKQEFGPSRSRLSKREDLHRGFQRLTDLLGNRVARVFIPPWNRCDAETLNLLLELGYRAVSRNHTAAPTAPLAVPEFPVNVDLHTRREKSVVEGWENLLEELATSLSSGFCGIMIHHQRMNDSAYGFLDLLLSSLRNWDRARLVHLGSLVRHGDGLGG